MCWRVNFLLLWFFVCDRICTHTRIARRRATEDLDCNGTQKAVIEFDGLPFFGGEGDGDNDYDNDDAYDPVYAAFMANAFEEEV